MNMLPVGARDDAAALYINAFDSDASKRAARSRLEQAARALLGMAPAKRPTRIGARTLKVNLERVPWSAATPDDCAQARDHLLETHSRRSAGAICGALRGALRQAEVLAVQHLDALRVDAQLATGRTVREVVGEWNADDAMELRAALDADGGTADHEPDLAERPQ